MIFSGCTNGLQTRCGKGINGDANCGCVDLENDYMYGSTEGATCICHYPNTGADCSGGTVCMAGGTCTAYSEVMDNILMTGSELRFFDAEKQEDGSVELRQKPTSWFGDEIVGTRPMSVEVWSWLNDDDAWVVFDEFNTASLKQALQDDRSVAIVEFPGFARGSVIVNLGDMTLRDTSTPDEKLRAVRRHTTPGQQKIPETLNGRILAETLPDTESLRRATVLP